MYHTQCHLDIENEKLFYSRNLSCKIWLCMSNSLNSLEFSPPLFQVGVGLEIILKDFTDAAFTMLLSTYWMTAILRHYAKPFGKYEDIYHNPCPSGEDKYQRAHKYSIHQGLHYTAVYFKNCIKESLSERGENFQPGAIENRGCIKGHLNYALNCMILIALTSRVHPHRLTQEDRVEKTWSVFRKYKSAALLMEGLCFREMGREVGNRTRGKIINRLPYDLRAVL